jgi:hypothetical protein
MNISGTNDLTFFRGFIKCLNTSMLIYRPIFEIDSLSILSMPAKSGYLFKLGQLTFIRPFQRSAKQNQDDRVFHSN